LSKKPRETANVGSGLWKATGMWAWLLFRISGLVLVFYLGAHILVISTSQWSEAGRTLNDLMKAFDHPVLVLLDLALVVAVLYHALNGVRVILMDLGIGVKSHKVVYWVCMAAAVALFAVFAYVAFTYLATGKGVS
jgi:succinate dehydrogenase / fumarate reductase cytochrome b subunit